MGTFLDDYEEMGPVVTRNSDLMTPVTFTSQMANSNSHMDFISLAPGKAGRNMDRSLSGFRLPQVMRVSLHMKGGRVSLCAGGGAVTVYYGKEKYLLNQGDSIYYDSIVDHLVTASGDAEAQILGVVYSPA